jgi:glutathione S-transferase
VTETGAHPVLLTFAPMVDSETSRLLLRHYGIAYEERDHLFGWVSLLTWFHGGYGRIPLLHGAGLRLTGPWNIVRHFDPLLDANSRLIPDHPSLEAEVLADWETYNGGLATDMAVFAYFHLLPERGLMSPVFAEPVPPAEARLTPALYPFLAFLLGTLLRLSGRRAGEAADRIRALFDRTGRRIADGRPYLCGERITLGDIALAAASAPLLLPPGYGASMPPRAAMPPPVQGLSEALRAHPAGRFVERLYSGGFAAARG